MLASAIRNVFIPHPNFIDGRFRESFLIAKLPAALSYSFLHVSSRVYKWLVVLMLWFVCLLNYADRQAIYSVFPVLKSQYGLSDLQLGYIASSFMWVYAIAGPFG